MLCALLVYVVFIIRSFYQTVCYQHTVIATAMAGDTDIYPEPHFTRERFHLLEIELHRGIIRRIVLPVP